MNISLIEKVILLYPLYAIAGYLVWTISQNNKKIKSLEEKINKRFERTEKQFDDYVHNIELKPVEFRLNNVEDDVKKVDKKITSLESNVMTLNGTIEERIKSTIENSLQLRSYMTTIEKNNLDMELLRSNMLKSIDLDVVDKKIGKIADDVTELFFRERYFGHSYAYDLNTGLFNMPNITEESKTKDIKDLYDKFIISVDSKYLYNELDSIYNMDKLESKVFLIEKYLIPRYSDKLERMIDDWQNIQKKLSEEANQRALEERRERDLLRAEKERQESEFGKLENAINKVYAEMRKEK